MYYISVFLLRKLYIYITFFFNFTGITRDSSVAQFISPDRKHTYVQRAIKQRAIFTNIHIKLETGPDGNSDAGSKWRDQWGR